MNGLQGDIAAAKIEPELLAGERLLWWGQPLTSVIFHKQDWALVPFSLLWGGFAIFWEAGALGFGRPTQDGETLNFMALWGIPFIVIGQYLIWGRFLYAAWRKRRTYYGLTDRRVLVVFEGMSRSVMAGYLSTLPAMNMQEGPRESGSIDFSGTGFSAFTNSEKRQRSSSPWTGGLGMLAFIDIPDVRQVYREVVKTRDASRDAIG